MNIEQYTIAYSPTKSGEVSFQLDAKDKKKSDAIKYPHRMLYIVKLEDEFLYVGEAKAELTKRFQRSFGSYRHFKRAGKARGGYKGYKWIKLLDPTEGTPRKLNVWVVLFPSSFDNNREFIEAIEGEAVWEIRRRTEQWPTFQNEIHFNNDLQEARTMTNTILEKIQEMVKK